MSDLRYWIWMQQALGEGAYIKQILEDFETPEKLYKSNILEWRMSPALSAGKIAKLEKTPLAAADKIIAVCDKNNWSILCYDNKNYPQRLREIPDPPAVLYIDGFLPEIDDLVVIGMVGARRASQYAVKVTSIMAQGIAEAGAVVVSGAALGVDTAAHQGALAGGGKTIGVLGCGLGANYLMENDFLRKQIRQNGALVSEFAPFSKPTKYTFPIRNRIISGLSVGLLVAEASVKSGSLITARCALEQNRDVFAIPGSVISTEFAGTNKLIDDGAFIVTKPVHLLEQYTLKFNNIDIDKVRTVEELMQTPKKVQANIPAEEDGYSIDNLEKGREERILREENKNNLSQDEKKVLLCLTEAYMHIDTIIQESGLSGSLVLGALTRLEIFDLVKSTSGKRYKLS